MERPARQQPQPPREQREGQQRAARGGGASTSGAVRFRTVHHSTVADVLRARHGWVETESELEWDLFWADTAWCLHPFWTLDPEP